MSFNPDLLEKEGKKVVLLGNEAIARGALECGLGVSANYPGTPSSEVGIALASVAKQVGFYFEWSTNEKVAFEVCAGASYAGVPSLTAMKHFGLNVALDSVLPVVYTGVRGGLVLVVADDPEGHSSAQSEEDTRGISRLGLIPTLEPSNPQECKDFTKKAFEISQKYEIPVMLRTTTMVSHSIGVVKLGKLQTPKTKGEFVKDFNRYYNLPPYTKQMHDKVNKKLEQIEVAYSYLNRVEGQGRIGIIANGVSYEYVKELGKIHGVKIAKIGMTHPLPKKFISDFIKDLKIAIVVEELEPWIEKFVRMVAKDVNPKLEIHGNDILPRIGEYTPDIVFNALAPYLKLKKPDFSLHDAYLKKIQVPVRKAVLCQGCPHRSTFYAVKKVMGENTIWAGDIGCYILGIHEPFKMADFVISMGASLGIAHGIQKVSNQKVVVFIGDSTFFHAGMAGLANTVSQRTKPLVIIMDNGVTAMTGHQPHPGSDFTATGERQEPMKIEEIVKAFGVKNLRVVNAYNQRELQAAIKEFAEKDEIGVIISRGLCRLHMKRLLKKQGKEFTKFMIDPNKCKKCLTCVKQFACPAIIKEGDKIFIKQDLCWGCGVCAQICPFGAISPVIKKKKGR